MSRPSIRQPIRIAVLHFAHETVSFLPNDTTLEDFTYDGSPVGGERLLAHDPRSYMGGFVKVAREHDGVELIGIESPLWPRTGTGSGWITEHAFETLAGRMLTDLASQGPVDGVYLSLHGAMAVRGVARPEAELARRVRAVVGPQAVLVGTFDPHGNEDEEFLRHADMAFTVKYFPHYDSYLQGERAARMLVRAIRGDYRPATAIRRVPILTATVLQWTGASPWMDLVQRALTWEAREPDLYVNVFFGFPFADVPDAGMTIQAMSNGNPALAARAVDDMARTAWRLRERLLGSATVHEMAAGVALAKQAIARGETPVVLADHSDRSGSATWLLREILAQDLSGVLVATLADAGSVAACQASGLKAGDPFDREVGGRVDDSAGPPVRIRGTVLSVVEGYGQPWIVVAFGRDNVLVLSRWLVQVQEPEPLRALNLDIAAFKAFAIKSRVHFRRGFDDSGFAPTILLVEPAEPHLGTTRLDALPYRNLDVRDYYPYGNPAFP
ncbi:MAG: M81 family metallopeptidase [Reyranellaceae bacterium]